MICGNCGNFVQDGAPNCPTCGAPMGMNPGGMNQQPMGMNPNGMYQGPMGMNPNGMYQGPMGMNPGEYGQPGMTKSQFYKHPLMKKIRSNLITCGVAGYILAALNILFCLFIPETGSGWLDAICMLGLSLGIHLGKSRVCAIIFAAYGCLNVLYFLIVTQQIQGYWIPIVGIYACIYTFKFHSAWKKYQQTGQIAP